MNGPVQNEQPQPKPQEAADAGSFVKPAITPETQQFMQARDEKQTAEFHNELGQIPLNPTKVEALKAQPTNQSQTAEPTTTPQSIGITPQDMNASDIEFTHQSFIQPDIERNLKDAA